MKNNALNTLASLVAHPGKLVLIIALAFAAATIISAIVVVVMQRHEERKAAQQRARNRELEAALALTHDLSKRGPTGFRRPA